MIRADRNPRPSGRGGRQLGDPNVPHAATGSPFNTNYVRIEGNDIGSPGAANLCPNPPDGIPTNCIQDSLFSVQGQYSINKGVQPDRATYARSSLNGGQIQVIAHSDAGQAIQVARTPTARSPPPADRLRTGLLRIGRLHGCQAGQRGGAEPSRAG
jgi:hypothetical protein